jgi:hypothetical protein
VGIFLKKMPMPAFGRLLSHPENALLALHLGHAPYNENGSLESTRRNMPLSGEAIRLMNYIDDVAVTLRRVLAAVPTLSAEERARVAEHLLRARPNAEEVAAALAVK